MDYKSVQFAIAIYVIKTMWLSLIFTVLLP